MINQVLLDLKIEKILKFTIDPKNKEKFYQILNYLSNTLNKTISNI